MGLFNERCSQPKGDVIIVHQVLAKTRVAPLRWVNSSSLRALCYPFNLLAQLVNYCTIFQSKIQVDQCYLCCGFSVALSWLRTPYKLKMYVQMSCSILRTHSFPLLAVHSKQEKPSRLRLKGNPCHWPYKSPTVVVWFFIWVSFPPSNRPNIYFIPKDVYITEEVKKSSYITSIYY